MFSQRQWDELSAFAASFVSPGAQPQQQHYGNGQDHSQHAGGQHSFFHQQSQQQHHHIPPQQQHNFQHGQQAQHQQQQSMLHQPPQQYQQQYQYGIPQQPQQPQWPRFGVSPQSAQVTTPNISQDSHGLSRGLQVSNTGGMDWTPSSDFDSSFQQHSFDVPQHDGMGSSSVAFGTSNTMSVDDSVSSDGPGRGGVGRLVAQFESKDFSPPLPPRPTSNAIASPIAIGQQYQPQQQQQPSSPFDFEPSNHNNSFTSTSFHSNRFDSPSDTNFGSYGTTQSRVMSPIATSPGPMSFGSFHDASRMTSPTTAPTSDPFGNLDFLAGSQMSSLSHSPMVESPTPTTPASSVPGGTPGFAIWRPPGQQAGQRSHQQTPQRSVPSNFQPQTQPQQPEPMNRAPERENTKISISNTNSSGYFRPPIPSTPKPLINAGNQFILELNPGSKPKGKAPAKPPKPRAPKPTNISLASLTPTIKSEPFTPQLPEISTPSGTGQDDMSESATPRPPMGNRPSREQVPAQAWEGLKTTIRDLYLEQRKPLKEVMSIMADKYNFQATPKMYKTRFSQWGFVKNNTEDEVKRLLSKKFQRDAEGKVSEFVRNGKVIDLGTYLKRKGVTEYDLVDFDINAELPSHIRCRTPTPPPAPEYLKSPDLLRAQELVVGNMRKAFLQCRQVEIEMERNISWSSIMIWGAPSSELLTEANFFFEAGDNDSGGQSLMNAFNQLEVDLKQLSPQGIIEVMLGMVRRDAGLMTALCKYVAAFSTTNYDRSHPLRQIFTCLYDVQQKHGAATLSDLLWGSTPLVADELEAMYGHRHPYVARTWIDLALVYEHKNIERLEKLVLELKVLHRQMEQQQDAEQADLLSLRCAIAQVLYAIDTESDAARHAAKDLWKDMKKMNLVFRARDTRPHTYCYHCPVKVDPWSKRCRRRYDSEVELLEKLVEVKILPYFEEDFHTTQHELDSQDAWAAAMSQQQQMGGNRWGFV